MTRTANSPNPVVAHEKNVKSTPTTTVRLTATACRYDDTTSESTSEAAGLRFPRDSSRHGTALAIAQGRCLKNQARKALQRLAAPLIIRLMPAPRLLRNPLPPRECPICHRPFSPYRSWQRTCRPACRHELYWRTHRIIRVPFSDTPSQTAAVPGQPADEHPDR